jgi:hypothetical protein
MNIASLKSSYRTRLPQDLKVMIINLMELKGPEGIDKTSEQLRQANAYIFAHKEHVNDSWQAK